jgi:hypothetical protein
MIPKIIAHPATTIAITPSVPNRNLVLSVMVSAFVGSGMMGLVGVGLNALLLIPEGIAEEVGKDVGLRTGEEGDTIGEVAGASEVLGGIDGEGDGATLVAGGRDVVSLIRGKSRRLPQSGHPRVDPPLTINCLMSDH